MTRALTPLFLTPLALASLAFVGCGGPSAVAADPPAPHERTEIPIDITRLTPEQSDEIRRGHASDPTPYLMRSRPIVFQVVEARNGVHEVRRSGPLTERAQVMVYAQGEADGDRLVDHGWIQDASGARLWEMTPANSVHGGGDPRNRKSVATLWLEPGTYELHYVTDEAHAWGDWVGAPPEREGFYGIVVFNLAGIAAIRERWREAGLEPD